MTDKTIHVITHSHWDREWYMPFEHFRIRLVDLFDQVLALLETPDNGFESFHADGHVLLIDDYLEIRPEQEARVRGLVAAGKLLIGPWYVLQDAFLTSGEAQVRNMLYGIRRAEELGGTTRIGYFPDTFGNISQSAQILDGFGIRHAVFGRGINPVAEDNKVINEGDNDFQSEVRWASPDGSEVLSAFLANWYHNGFELPTDREEAQQRMAVMIPNVERFAATGQLLLMNGCDHQPVQRDVGQAIALMQELLPSGYRVVHSNFPDYFAALEPQAQQVALRRVVGELTGQLTEGWGLLVNTASSRLYLKIWNARVQRELERWTEPFTLLAARFGMDDPRAFLRYAWKQLLLNHPHDSICGCSLDEVHREMETRFEKAMQVAQAWTDKALTYIAGRMPAPAYVGQPPSDDELSSPAAGSGHPGRVDKGYAITVFNPLERSRSYWTEVEVDAEQPLDPQHYAWFDSSGQRVTIRSEVADLGWVHGYTLPDDRFRIPWKKRRYRVRFLTDQVPAAGYACYYWLDVGSSAVSEQEASPAPAKPQRGDNGEWTMENEQLRLSVQPDGAMRLLDKRSGKQYTDILVLEDSGDIGNEYNYVQAQGEQEPRLSLGCALEAEECSVLGEQRLRLRQTWRLPLKREGMQRSEEEAEHHFEWLLRLPENGARVEVELAWINHASDHRLRVRVPTDLATDVVHADTPFDWTSREIEPWTGWRNPCHTERMQSRFLLQDKHSGLLVVADGLPEYEVLRDGRNTMALTLLRCVGELGDWNYFPTPEAQQLGRKQSVRFALILSGEEPFEAFDEADAWLLASRAVAHPLQEQSGAALPVRCSLVSLDESPTSVRLSALKCTEDGDNLVLRLVNLDEHSKSVSLGLEPCAGLTCAVQGGGVPAGYTAGLDERVRAALAPFQRDEEDGIWRLRDTIGAKKIATYVIGESTQKEENT